MKILSEKPKPPRPNIIIEFTPEEAWLLYRLVGNLTGTGNVRQVSDALYFKISEYYNFPTSTDDPFQSTPCLFNVRPIPPL